MYALPCHVNTLTDRRQEVPLTDDDDENDADTKATYVRSWVDGSVGVRVA